MSVPVIAAIVFGGLLLIDVLGVAFLEFSRRVYRRTVQRRDARQAHQRMWS